MGQRFMDKGGYMGKCLFVNLSERQNILQVLPLLFADVIQLH